MIRGIKLFLTILIFLTTFDFPSSAQNQETIYKPLLIDGVDREEVVNARNQFLQGDAFINLYNSLKRGEIYRYYIREKLIEKDLPEFLEYIPVIESSYKPTATPANGSSVGLWQFMENSIQPFLKKNQWLDERRDPWKSTDAALEKLKDNYRMFGDWALSLAAYNCGAGAVSRALKKSKGKDFWALCRENLIPLHAQKYVPNLIAVYDLVKNADYYGINLPELKYFPEGTKAFTDFDYIETDSQIYLKRLSSELKMEEKELSDLNLSLIKGCTLPDQKTVLRLPSGMGKAALDAIKSIKNEK